MYQINAGITLTMGMGAMGLFHYGVAEVELFLPFYPAWERKDSLPIPEEMGEGGVFLLLTVSVTGERCTSHRISERKKKVKQVFQNHGGDPEVRRERKVVFMYRRWNQRAGRQEIWENATIRRGDQDEGNEIQDDRKRKMCVWKLRKRQGVSGKTERLCKWRERGGEAVTSLYPGCVLLLKNMAPPSI